MKSQIHLFQRTVFGHVGASLDLSSKGLLLCSGMGFIACAVFSFFYPDVFPDFLLVNFAGYFMFHICIVRI
jgi:hypothetical protein